MIWLEAASVGAGIGLVIYGLCEGVGWIITRWIDR